MLQMSFTQLYKVLSLIHILMLTKSQSLEISQIESDIFETAEGLHCFPSVGDELQKDRFFMELKTRTALSTSSKKALLLDYLCKKCFFPQNCLSNNTCLVGTEGEGCEKCLAGFTRVGNTCFSCTDIPWRPIGLAVFIIVLSVGLLLNGISVSYCTKVKLLFDFLQLFILSQHLKIVWPSLLLHVTSIMTFVNLNSDVIRPSCIFNTTSRSLYYIEWITSLCLPTLVFIIGLIVDKKLTVKQEKDSCERNVIIMKRLHVRRFIYVIIVIMYVPVATSSIQNLSCSTNIPLDWSKEIKKDVFLYNYDVNCEKFLYQAFNLVCTLFLCVYVVAFPLFLILFALRQRKWSLLDEQFKSYGFAHESYKNSFCFWEAIPLIRKGITIAITDTYLFSTFIQAAILLGMTSLWFVATVLFRPYRRFTWKGCQCVNMHVIFEVLSTLCMGLVQIRGLLIAKDIMIEELGELDMVIIVFVGIVLLVWVILILTSRLEKHFDEVSWWRNSEYSGRTTKQR